MRKAVKSVGVIAGDAESYDVFGPLYEAILRLRFGPMEHEHRQPLAADLAKDLGELALQPLDPDGKHVLQVQVRLSRNLESMRFPSACYFEERRQVERSFASAFAGFDGDLAGSYHPLLGSDSFAAAPGGMTQEEQEIYQSRGMLFSALDSASSVASGLCRDWPDARGLFAAEAGGLWAWVNEEDHCKLFAQEAGPDLGACCSRICRAEAAIARALAQEGNVFARHERYGYLTTGPTNSGTALAISVLAKLPLVSARPDFRGLCKRLRLHSSYQRRLGS